jgi:hypothetical protein
MDNSSSDVKPALIISHREKMVAELLQGHDFATQLKNLVRKPAAFNGDCSVLAGELAEKVLGSFNQSLSFLSSNVSNCDHHSAALSHEANSFYDDSSPSVDDQRSEDSGHSRKRPAPASKDRRGCYKRKNNSETWSTVAAKVDDGIAWRKYGQKIILNAKHPRNYFRCTRKFEQGCKATKQVQRMEDDPQMYHITYIGAHTCTQLIKSPPQIISSSQEEKTNIIKQEQHNNFKVESTQQVMSISELTDNNVNHDEFHHISWKDVMNLPDYGDHSTTSSDCFLYQDFDFINAADFLLTST